jgi:hypothetical protein
MPNALKYELLRYFPNRLSEEFCNVAVFLYGAGGVFLDACFAPDFARLRSNPLADLAYLGALKAEFENRRLDGEGFSAYVEDLKLNLSQGLQLSNERFFLGAGDQMEEMARLARTYLATPRRSEVRPVEPAPDTRRFIRGRMRDTFQLYHLLDRLQSDVAVGAYVSPRFSFQVDFAYKPNGRLRYFQALSRQHDLGDASRLCFVFDRIRAQVPASMTAVTADSLPEDTRALLGSSHIEPWPVSRLDELALRVRDELGL